jgi:hypothetical protein
MDCDGSVTVLQPCYNRLVPRSASEDESALSLQPAQHMPRRADPCCVQNWSDATAVPHHVQPQTPHVRRECHQRLVFRATARSPRRCNPRECGFAVGLPRLFRARDAIRFGVLRGEGDSIRRSTAMSRKMSARLMMPTNRPARTIGNRLSRASRKRRATSATSVSGENTGTLRDINCSTVASRASPLSCVLSTS